MKVKDSKPVEVYFDVVPLSKLPAMIPMRQLGRFFGFKRDLKARIESTAKGQFVVIPFKGTPKEISAIKGAIQGLLLRHQLGWRAIHNPQTSQFLLVRKEEWDSTMAKKETSNV